MYHVHNLTLRLEDPLRDILGRIPRCTAYTIHLILTLCLEDPLRVNQDVPHTQGHVVSVSSCLEDIEGLFGEEQVIPCNYYMIVFSGQ